MDKKVGLSAPLGLWLLALSGICMASAQQDVKYIPLGGILEMVPDNSSVTEPITGILWKSGPNKVAEWDEVLGPDVDYYGRYRNRTNLTTETGKLVITNMTKNDSEIYSVHVNGRLQSKTYKIEVIKKVPKPSVAIKPPCSPQSTNCSVICEGDIRDSGPVTYRWKKDGGEWMESGPNPAHWSISSDEEGKKVEKVFCEMKNPFSVEQSDPCNNLFHPKAQQDVIYIPQEGTLQLIPDARSVQLTTAILWKRSEKELAKWDRDKGTFFFEPEKHTQLINATGMLVVNNMMKEDSGEYSVEVNGRMQCKTYTVEVIRNVSKPSVVAISPPCSPQSTNCSVICEGNIKDSGPVTYRWKKDGGEWRESGPNPAHWSITNDEEGKKVDKIFCEVKNPVSEEQSDPFNNPFYPNPDASMGGIIRGMWFLPLCSAGLVLGYFMVI